MTCRHLYPLEKELLDNNVKETFRGQAWTDNTREWVYFDCYLDIDEINKRLEFPDFVVVHENSDPKSGTERGFYCKKCHDGIMGHLLHQPGGLRYSKPAYERKKRVG